MHRVTVMGNADLSPTPFRPYATWLDEEPEVRASQSISSRQQRLQCPLCLCLCRSLWLWLCLSLPLSASMCLCLLLCASVCLSTKLARRRMRRAEGATYQTHLDRGRGTQATVVPTQALSFPLWQGHCSYKTEKSLCRRDPLARWQPGAQGERECRG